MKTIIPAQPDTYALYEQGNELVKYRIIGWLIEIEAEKYHFQPLTVAQAPENGFIGIEHPDGRVENKFGVFENINAFADAVTEFRALN